MKRVDLEQWRAREVARLLALVEAERRYYQEIVANIPVGLAVLADDLTFLSANRTFRAILGLGNEALGRVRMSDIFPEEGVGQRVSQVLETGVPQRGITLPAKGQGISKPIRLSIQPFQGWSDESGSEALLLVDEAGDAETPAQLERKPEGMEETEEAEVKVDAAGEFLENLDAIVWERDASTSEFTYVTGRTEEILGFEASQWLSSPAFFTERIHPEDRPWVEAFYKQALTASKSRSCEYRALHSNGRTVWLRDVVRVRTDLEGTPVRLAGITVDISAQRQVGEQAAQTEKMAALSRLASKVTHDCNNLLMIMSGYGEELLSNLPKDHPSRDDVSEILAATQRLSKITNELLTFTRRPMLLPKVTDLNSVIEGIEEKLRRELGDRIELNLGLAEDLDRVSADSEAIADSILRLAECSRDAMPEGGRIQIETANIGIHPHAGSVIPAGHYVTVTVSDTGPVLDEENRTRLFEPFYSGPRASRSLATVYSVIKNSHGDIEVSSGEDHGVSFTIYLPRTEEETPEPQVMEPVEVAEVVAEQPMETVLVVEDEGGIRALMRKILQKQGYNVLEASRGDEALEVSEGHQAPIDLLLTDVVMPQMSGRELANRLKAERPSMKVLFVSGYTDEDLLQYGPLPAGAAFLQKPFSLAALLEKTRAVLNGEPVE